MKLSWRRLLKIAISVEVCLWALGNCPIWFNTRGYIESSQPLLIDEDGSTIMVIRSHEEPNSYRDSFNSQWNPPAFQKLSRVLARNTPDPHARRTMAGGLIDDNGRSLLSHPIEKSVAFAYSPQHDLLVWGHRLSRRLNIRQGERVRTIFTWDIRDVQIRPDGTIWLAETCGLSGVAVLDREGRFQGWRAYGGDFNIQRFAEVSPPDVPLVERLLAEKDAYPRF